MLLDEINKAKLTAFKNRDNVARGALSVLYSKCFELVVENRSKGVQTEDKDLYRIITKFIKELEDEKQMYVNNSRPDKVEEISHQIEAVSMFKPQLMSEAEVRQIIEKLADKSIKNIMSTFKKDYDGKVDMAMVSRLAKEYQAK